MSYSYDDDEPGSPWTLVLHVDGPNELGESFSVARRRPHEDAPLGTEVQQVGAGAERAYRVIEGGVRVGADDPHACNDPRRDRSSVSCIVLGTIAPVLQLINDELSSTICRLRLSCMAPARLRATSTTRVTVLLARRARAAVGRRVRAPEFLARTRNREE